MRIVRLTEEGLQKILKNMLNEDITPSPVFGKGRSYIDYKPHIESLSKITNLHNDRYKNYELDKSWNEWKNTGYDKNSQEYLLFLSDFKSFMFGTGGFLDGLQYTLGRLTGAPLHSVLLDPRWVSSLNGRPQWSLSTSRLSDSDEWQCFYTVVLKIFQNPAIWNDFFFNPFFEKYKKMYDDIRGKLNKIMVKDFEMYEKNYIPLLPLDEYKQLILFAREVNQETKKVEKGLNNKPELYYDPNFKQKNNDFDTNVDDDMFD